MQSRFTSDYVINVVREHNALVKTLASNPADDESWEFHLNQLADPENVRPIRELVDGCDRTQRLNMYTGVWETRNIPDPKRGRPKPSIENIKATSGTLWPRDGRMRLYNHSNEGSKAESAALLFHADINKNVPKDPLTGYALDKEHRIVRECFSKDSGTNTKFWIKGMPLNSYHQGQYPKAKTLVELRKENDQFMRSMEVGMPRHHFERNEVRMKPRKRDTIGIVALNKDVKQADIDILNALYRQAYAMNKLFTDDGLPIELGVVFQNDAGVQALSDTMLARTVVTALGTKDLSIMDSRGQVRSKSHLGILIETIEKLKFYKPEYWAIIDAYRLFLLGTYRAHSDTSYQEFEVKCYQPFLINYAVEEKKQIEEHEKLKRLMKDAHARDIQKEVKKELEVLQKHYESRRNLEKEKLDAKQMDEIQYQEALEKNQKNEEKMLSAKEKQINEKLRPLYKEKLKRSVISLHHMRRGRKLAAFMVFCSGAKVNLHDHRYWNDIVSTMHRNNEIHILKTSNAKLDQMPLHSYPVYLPRAKFSSDEKHREALQLAADQVLVERKKQRDYDQMLAAAKIAFRDSAFVRMKKIGLQGDLNQLYDKMIGYLKEYGLVTFSFQPEDLFPNGLKHFKMLTVFESAKAEKAGLKYQNNRNASELLQFADIDSPELKQEFEKNLSIRPRYAAFILADKHTLPFGHGDYGSSFIVFKVSMMSNMLFSHWNALAVSGKLRLASFHHLEILLDQLNDHCLQDLAWRADPVHQPKSQSAIAGMEAYLPPLNLLDKNVVSHIHIDAKKYRLKPDEEALLKHLGLSYSNTKGHPYQELLGQLNTYIENDDLKNTLEILKTHPVLLRLLEKSPLLLAIEEGSPKIFTYYHEEQKQDYTAWLQPGQSIVDLVKSASKASRLATSLCGAEAILKQCTKIEILSFSYHFMQALIKGELQVFEELLKVFSSLSEENQEKVLNDTLSAKAMSSHLSNMGVKGMCFASLALLEALYNHKNQNYFDTLGKFGFQKKEYFNQALPYMRILCANPLAELKKWITEDKPEDMKALLLKMPLLRKLIEKPLLLQGLESASVSVCRYLSEEEKQDVSDFLDEGEDLLDRVPEEKALLFASRFCEPESILKLSNDMTKLCLAYHLLNALSQKDHPAFEKYLSIFLQLPEDEKQAFIAFQDECFTYADCPFQQNPDQDRVATLCVLWSMKQSDMTCFHQLQKVGFLTAEVLKELSPGMRNFERQKRLAYEAILFSLGMEIDIICLKTDYQALLSSKSMNHLEEAISLLEKYPDQLVDMNLMDFNKSYYLPFWILEFFQDQTLYLERALKVCKDEHFMLEANIRKQVLGVVFQKNRAALTIFFKTFIWQPEDFVEIIPLMISHYSYRYLQKHEIELFHEILKQGQGIIPLTTQSLNDLLLQASSQSVHLYKLCKPYLEKLDVETLSRVLVNLMTVLKDYEEASDLMKTYKASLLSSRNIKNWTHTYLQHLLGVTSTLSAQSLGFLEKVMNFENYNEFKQEDKVKVLSAAISAIDYESILNALLNRAVYTSETLGLCLKQLLKKVPDWTPGLVSLFLSQSNVKLSQMAPELQQFESLFQKKSDLEKLPKLVARFEAPPDFRIFIKPILSLTFNSPGKNPEVDAFIQKYAKDKSFFEGPLDEWMKENELKLAEIYLQYCPDLSSRFLDYALMCVLKKNDMKARSLISALVLKGACLSRQHFSFLLADDQRWDLLESILKTQKAPFDPGLANCLIDKILEKIRNQSSPMPFIRFLKAQKLEHYLLQCSQIPELAIELQQYDVYQELAAFGFPAKGSVIENHLKNQLTQAFQDRNRSKILSIKEIKRQYCDFNLGKPDGLLHPLVAEGLRQSQLFFDLVEMGADLFEKDRNQKTAIMAWIDLQFQKHHFTQDPIAAIKAYQKIFEEVFIKSQPGQSVFKVNAATREAVYSLFYLKISHDLASANLNAPLSNLPSIGLDNPILLNAFLKKDYFQASQLMTQVSLSEGVNFDKQASYANKPGLQEDCKLLQSQYAFETQDKKPLSFDERKQRFFGIHVVKDENIEDMLLIANDLSTLDSKEKSIFIHRAKSFGEYYVECAVAEIQKLKMKLEDKRKIEGSDAVLEGLDRTLLVEQMGYLSTCQYLLVRIDERKSHDTACFQLRMQCMLSLQEASTYLQEPKPRITESQVKVIVNTYHQNKWHFFGKKSKPISQSLQSHALLEQLQDTKINAYEKQRLSQAFLESSAATNTTLAAVLRKELKMVTKQDEGKVQQIYQHSYPYKIRSLFKQNPMSKESQKALEDIVNAQTYEEKYRILMDFVKAYPEKRFAKALRFIIR